MCPVCTVTVVAGLGVSRFLGIDDVITSLWIGAFVLSVSFITIAWIAKKWPRSLINNYGVLIITLVYFLVLIPLVLNKSIGISTNTLWGIDKIILGTFIGSLVFLLGIFLDKRVREIYKKQFFSFQRVVFPVLALIITSFIFYLITND